LSWLFLWIYKLECILLHNIFPSVLQTWGQLLSHATMASLLRNEIIYYWSIPLVWMRRGVFYVICMFCLTCLLLKVVFTTITLTHVYPKGQLGGRHGRDYVVWEKITDNGFNKAIFYIELSKETTSSKLKIDWLVFNSNFKKKFKL
jgi:hypothetical protein